MQDSSRLCLQLYVFFKEFLLLSAALILLFRLKARHVAEPSVLIIVVIFCVHLFFIFFFNPTCEIGVVLKKKTQIPVYDLGFVSLCCGSQMSVGLRMDTNGFTGS